MAQTKLLNYTSTVGVVQTVQQIQNILSNHGVGAVMVRYTEKKPTGISFTLVGPFGPRSFTLPADVRAVQKVLDQQWSNGLIPRKNALPEQAERTAWRIVKDWLEAQLALVEARLADLEKIMLPYMHTGDANSPTVWDRYIETGQASIEAGKG